jgi:hypothetical protein
MNALRSLAVATIWLDPAYNQVPMFGASIVERVLLGWLSNDHGE